MTINYQGGMDLITWEENSEDAQKRSYEPCDDGRYETAIKEEKKKNW